MVFLSHIRKKDETIPILFFISTHKIGSFYVSLQGLKGVFFIGRKCRKGIPLFLFNV